jgi:hypothetical protein
MKSVILGISRAIAVTAGTKEQYTYAVAGSCRVTGDRIGKFSFEHLLQDKQVVLTPA